MLLFKKYIYEMQSKILPDIFAGDIIIVHEKIIEAKKVRIQKFEGLVMYCRHKKNSITKTVLLRKKIQNYWVEKTFLLYSPLIEKVEIISRGNARRAYLSYLRDSKELSAKLKRLKK